MGNETQVPNSYLRILENQEIRNHYFDLVKTYSYTIANGAIWLATLLAIYSSIDIE